jgi:diguanylate cyclase (GGDEF)-like protein/PAS domain S-box-containing protein
MSMRRRRSVLIAVMTVLVAGMVFSAVDLVSSQSMSRRDVETRYSERARVGASLITSTFVSSALLGQAELAKRFGAGVVSPQVLAAGAKQSNLRYAALLDPLGRVISASPGASHATVAALKATPERVRRVEAGRRFGLSDVLGPAGAQTIEYVQPIRTVSGRLMLVDGFPRETISAFLAGYLHRIPNVRGGSALVVDSRGEIIGSGARMGPAPQGRIDPSLEAALRTHARSAYDHNRFFASSRVGGSPWRMVITGPQARVFASVRGTRKWIPWLLLVGFGLAASLALALLVRALRSSEALEEVNERYALAVRGANDGIWDWDISAGTIYFAPRWKAMLGHSDADVGADPQEWLGRIHPEDQPRVEHALDAHLASRSPHFESEHRMRTADGSYLWMFSRGVATRDEGGRATRLAGSMSDITGRKAAEEQLIHDALHDALTGLPNRALLTDRLTLSLDRARRLPGRGCAVLFLDLDRFKVVNDSFSHAVGDQLLIAFAQRMSKALRPGDTVARLGGDEFAVLLEDVETPEQARIAAQRIHALLAESFQIEGHELVISGSIGVSLSESASQPAHMMRNADIAMYDAKRDGKDRIAIFNTKMHRRVVSELQVETELRAAIEEQRLQVFYQPIVSLADGRISGFEALARGPAGGPEVEPEVFIPVAEDAGMISDLSRLVFTRACEQMSAWRASRLVADTTTVSVNVSRGHILEGSLVPDVEAALAASGLPGRNLRLEITESTIMRDPELMRTTLEELERLGVRAQIDDFGTGYSSLTFLHHFRGDTLKIDRSFIASMNRDSGTGEIVRATISMAHNLGLSVVAEGVEDPADLDVLVGLGCEYGQGFLWSRPIDPVGVESLVARFDARRRQPAASPS